MPPGQHAACLWLARGVRPPSLALLGPDSALQDPSIPSPSPFVFFFSPNPNDIPLALVSAARSQGLNPAVQYRGRGCTTSSYTFILYKSKSHVCSWGSWVCGFAATEKTSSCKTLEHLLASPNSDGTERYRRSCCSWWAGWYRSAGASDCWCYTWAWKIRPPRLAPAGFPHPAEMTRGQKLLWAKSDEVGHGGCPPQECF